MRAIAWLLRVFCYIFHTVFSVCLLGFGGLAILARASTMKVEMLPWQGTELNYWLIGLGLLGLVSVFLAITGRFRPLLALWSIGVFGMLIKDIFLSSAVTFSGPDDFHNWLWITAGAGIAMIGSFLALTRRPV
jgi:hypothetical protein